MSTSKDVKDMSMYSPLQKERLSYKPPLPPVFNNPSLKITEGETCALATSDPSVIASVKEQFLHVFSDKIVKLVPSDTPEPNTPMKVGVVLSGGQAPGGHNVIAGLFDYIKKNNPESKLFGFLNGPKGVFTGKYVEITAEYLEPYRNQGGFDIIGSGRDKIETEEQFKNSLENCKKLDLDGLVVIGGDDSNTNAAVLAEYFKKNNLKTKVIGVPKTIDGDLKGPFIETSFGFDTACKTYSELIGNVEIDSRSSKKYYHFIRLMGRAASHITLECALQTHPNYTFIGEQVEHDKVTMKMLVNDLCDMICKRAENGKNFGVVLIPEGLIDFVPEIHNLIEELNELLAKKFSEISTDGRPDFMKVAEHLSPESRDVFLYLPAQVRDQLMLDRDSHGNVQLSKIETERLIITLAEIELNLRKKDGKYKGTFSTLTHFLGYEGRCGLPSLFDSDYCYTLGYTAGNLIRLGATGVMSFAKNLTKDAKEWEVGGVPITTMIHMEKRKGKLVPVIKKALVDLEGKPYKEFLKNREKWMFDDCYTNPGPIQFHGPAASIKPMVMVLEH